MKRSETFIKNKKEVRIEKKVAKKLRLKNKKVLN